MTDEPFYVSLASSLAIKLAGDLLDATARRVKEKFSGDDQQQALIAALQEGLETSLSSFHLEKVNEDHFKSLFENFLSKPNVVDELTQLIDPRPNVGIDIELLRHEFDSEGFDSETLIYFDYDTFIRLFAHAFYDAAAKQEKLQGAIQIGLLRTIVDQLSNLAINIERTASATEQTAAATAQIAYEFSPLMESFLGGQARGNELTEEIRRVAQQGFEQLYELLDKLIASLHKHGYDITLGDDNTLIIGDSNRVNTMTSQIPLGELQSEISHLIRSVNTHKPSDAELSIIENRYRQHIQNWFERLTFQGMMRTAQTISLPLEDVYVELRAIGEVPEAADTFSAEERRLLLEVDDGDEYSKQELMRQLDTMRKERWSRVSVDRKSITETLFMQDKRAFVILGDPGSGKSTLLHLLALVYAKGPDAIKRHLKAPEQELRRLPIIVPLAAFDDMLRANPGMTLLEFLPKYFERRRMVQGLAPLFEKALENGSALILLDGLDEVLDSSTRSYVANQVTSLINEYSPRGVRFVLTSRFVGYREAPVGQDIPHLSVLDFGVAEIRTFVHQWSHTYESWAAGGVETPEAIHKAHVLEKDLLEDVNSIPSVRRLAANPLMLTMLALLRRQVGRLPHRRIELYKRYMDTMIDNWVDARSQGEREHALALSDPHRAESLLIPLAYWLQSTQPSGTASKAIIQDALTDICLKDEGYDPAIALRAQRKAAEEQAQSFLKEMREMSGLIVERGFDAFGFLHLTFQEYFAGRALAKMDPKTRWTEVHPHLHDSRWREPILLCAGQLGVVENRRDVVSEFVSKILSCDDPTENDLHRNLLLALSIACDDVNLEHSLLNELVTKAMSCLTTNINALAGEITRRLGQLIVNGVSNAEAFLSLIDDAKDSALRNTMIQAVEDFIEFPVIRQTILQRLDDRNGSVRSSAVRALASLVASDADVRQAILKSLDDEADRSSAVHALASLVASDADVRQAILKSLDDQNWVVRWSAVEVLASLVASDTDVRQAIFQRLDDQDGSVRSSAVEALASLVASDADVRQAIFQRLDDQNWVVRSSAFIAMYNLENLDLLEKDKRLVLMNWLAARFDSVPDQENFEKAKERLHQLFGQKLTSDHSLQDLMLEWLKSPRWPTRLGAVLTLLYWPGGTPKEILYKILESLNDNRGLESYPARLTAARYLINRDPHSEAAIQLGLEALEFGTLPWESFHASREVRQQAALLLGTLEPVRYDQAVYDKLLHAMKTDQESSVRDAAYSTLVKLAGIRDTIASQSVS